MDITEENPIRILDLNKYPLSEENINDKQLIKWTKEIIHTFTSNNSQYPDFKNTVTKNVYNLPVGAKLSKYGARHFVMKEQCAMTDEEIEKLRSEAINKYSPYWYGMISTCHFSGHITLKIAQMLFPLESWIIINTPGHTFVTNLSLNSIVNIFSDISPLTKEVNARLTIPNTGLISILRIKEKIKEMSKVLSPYIIDKAEYKEAYPMIIDLLATDKQTFLDLVANASHRYIKSYTSPNEFRKSLIQQRNIRKVPLTMNIRNYFYRNKTTKNTSGKGGRRRYTRRK